MKTLCQYIVIFCFGMITGAFALSSISSKEETQYVASPQDIESLSQTDGRDSWDTFRTAVGYIESGNDDTLVGTKNDVGRLQITPVLVKDANRILGYDKYSLDDRKDADKSAEIWNVIQDHYNPSHDLHLALKIWNPRAPLSYHRSIMTEYARLQAEAECTHQI